MHQNNTNPSRVIALSLALALTGGTFAPTYALASDIKTNDTIATTFDPTAEPLNITGDQIKVVNDTTMSLGALADFFGPEAKTVVVGSYMEYEALRQAAIVAGVTNGDRLRDTKIIVLPELAASFGIKNLQHYAERFELPGDMSGKSGLEARHQQMIAVYKHMVSRISAGTLLPMPGSAIFLT